MNGDREVAADRVAPDSPAQAPRISVVMANHRGGRFLEAAMRSVLAQSERDLELILADDASDDDSLAIAHRIAAGDGRVVVLPSTQRQGPAATRNRALDAARGTWLAVVDSDDLIHPERLARLVAAGEAAGADLVADDLVHFGNGEARTLLQPLRLTAPVPLTAADLLHAKADPAVPGYGYLKPAIRRATLGARRYDASLRIGEDHDLMLRMVLDGATFLLLPDPLYAYRRHGGSISHRLSIETVQAMLAAHVALPKLDDPDARAAAAAVSRQLGEALRYEEFVAAVKARRGGAVLRALATDPPMRARLVESLRDRGRRRAALKAGADPGTRARWPAPLPALPGVGAAWAHPPADAAAAIVACVQTGRVPAQADAAAVGSGWADWLMQAVRIPGA